MQMVIKLPTDLPKQGHTWYDKSVAKCKRERCPVKVGAVLVNGRADDIHTRRQHLDGTQHTVEAALRHCEIIGVTVEGTSRPDAPGNLSPALQGHRIVAWWVDPKALCRLKGLDCPACITALQGCHALPIGQCRWLRSSSSNSLVEQEVGFQIAVQCLRSIGHLGQSLAVVWRVPQIVVQERLFFIVFLLRVQRLRHEQGRLPLFPGMRQSLTAIAFCLGKTFRPHETTSHLELEARHATEFLDMLVMDVGLVEALLGSQKPRGGKLGFWSVTTPGRIGYITLRRELALTSELCCPCHFAEDVWRCGLARRHQINRTTICCYGAWRVAVG